ncbi:hypothetical protein EVAR_66351_1 [Eumeta japonica]|uniref:DUF5641 domain-containing protein n=1 Tax=Eumeta variegata TaxID=151549 RepID=A0A4C1ZTX7_EUMVA|nr:hypothetical protein EVAR_66351_1 [Eumeta japonica]
MIATCNQENAGERRSVSLIISGTGGSPTTPTNNPRRTWDPATHRNPKMDDFVLIADGALPGNTKPRGEILAVYPGQDQVIRVVDVKTDHGIRKIAILSTNGLTTKAMSPLNVQEESAKDHSPALGGDM